MKWTSMIYQSMKLPSIKCLLKCPSVDEMSIKDMSNDEMALIKWGQSHWVKTFLPGVVYILHYGCL